MDIENKQGRVEGSAVALSQPRNAAPALSPYRAAMLACLALLLAAPVFALATWQQSYTLMHLRYYSAPVVGVQLVVIYLAFLSRASLPGAWRQLNPTTKVAFAVFVAAVFAANLLKSAFLGVAIAGLLTTLIHLLLFAVCYERFCVQWRAMRLHVLLALSIGGAGYFILVFGLALSQSSNAEFNWANFGPGVSNVRQLAFYGLATAGISAGLLASAHSRRENVLYWVLMTVGAWCAFTSGGRAGAASLVVAVLVIGVLAKAGSRFGFAAKASVSLATAAGASTAFVPHHLWGIASVLRPTAPADSSEFYSGRIEIWLETWNAILQQPILGFGQGQFRFVVESAQVNLNHPHNSLLQFLFDWGLLGTAALAILVLTALKQVPLALRTDRKLALPSIGAALGLVAMSMLDGALHYPYPVMIVLISAAVLLSIEPKRIHNV